VLRVRVGLLIGVQGRGDWQVDTEAHCYDRREHPWNPQAETEVCAMMWNDALQKILNDLQTETKEDLVGLWLLQGWVQDAFPEMDASAVREATLMVVERAFESGEVVAGSFIDHEFAIWPTQDHEAMNRIVQIRKRADRDLDLNDNVWLSGRDLGYRTVR
jgi:hypothetical protein